MKDKNIHYMFYKWDYSLNKHDSLSRHLKGKYQHIFQNNLKLDKPYCMNFHIHIS